MICQTVRKSISAFLDRALADEERIRVSQHLASCRACAAYRADLERTGELMRHLPVVSVPARLASQLRVLASHERARLLSRISLEAKLTAWWSRTWLCFDNLMRPLALPFAGGLLSAVFLFSVMLTTPGFRHHIIDDVALPLYTEASVVEMGPFGVDSDDTMVELTIDEHGQITDYTVPHGKMSPELHANIGNALLFSSFTPATWFGQPRSGKIRVSFKRVRYVVKG